MKKKNKFAVALGKLAAGHPKEYSMSERYRRAKRLTIMNKARKVVAVSGLVLLYSGILFWMIMEAGR